MAWSVTRLLDASRRATFDRLMKKGVGLVTFHQASTLPPQDACPRRPIVWLYGVHYLVGLDQPEFRKLLLNAIVWTAGLEVPKTGVRSGLPGRRNPNQTTGRARGTQDRDRRIRDPPPAENKVIDYPWGRLTWYVSRELKNSDTMTVGQAVIKPGQENPRHFHPQLR